MDLNGTKLMIFDLDGTLVDAFEDIASAVNHALEKLGFPRLDAKEIRRHVGNGVSQLMRDVMNLFPEEKYYKGETLPVEEGARYWKEYYLAHPADRSRLYPGTKDLISYLDKKKIGKAILTNKEHEVAREVTRTLGIDHCFDYILGDGAGIPRKPSPDGILFLMEKLGAVKEETWLVGDGPADMKAGVDAGCRVCGVTHGALERKTLKGLGAHVVIDSLSELTGG